MTNNMMVNVNRSMRNMDALSQQFFSNNKVTAPSDNPIIAARAMQFRTNLVHNANFQTNVDNGLAWMDVTESAMDGFMQTLMMEARDLVHRAANDPMALEDRNALMTALRSMFEQMGLQMNSQFAGRFVFSGLRTDQPPIFDRDQPNLSYEITQNFNLRDVERTRSLQIFPQVPGNPVQLPVVHDIQILKLAYTNVDLDAGGNPILDVVRADGSSFNVIMRSVNDLDAYDTSTISPGDVIYIPETGELVFHVDDVTGAGGQDNFPIQTIFDRTGFSRGELNPIVHFTSTDRNPPNLTFTMDNQDLEFEFSSHTKLPVNVLAKDVLTDKLFADMRRLIDFIGSIIPSDPDVLREFYRDLFPNASEGEISTEVERHLSEEKAFINSAMNDRFNNMLFLIDRHSAQIRTQWTDIGSRGRRLELIQNRLETDEGSLFRLMSNNENPDMARLTTLLATAEQQYMSAIRVGTNIINVTLANFIQI